MKLYHKIKEIASAAANFAAALYMLIAVMTAYSTACIGLYALPAPDWYAWGVRVTLGVPAAVFAVGVVLGAVRLAVQLRRPVRCGVIGADVICRVMEGKR